MNIANMRAGLSPERVRALTGIVNAEAGPEKDLGRWLDAQKVRIVGRVAVFQVDVTPQLAASWLRFNTKNRNPSKSKIRRFAAAMKAGKWTLNGECIKFGASGRLLDGQSRLKAIIEANVTVPLEVRGGVADAAQECMDTGEARKHSHQLEMLGEKYPNEIAAALRLVYFADKGYIGSQGPSGEGRDITNTTIRETLEKHPGIRESVGRCLNLRQLLPISVASFFHYLFAKSDEKAAHAFIDKLTTGANLAETSPIYQLRERLTQDRLAQAKLRRRDKFALIIKAWNAYRNRKTLTRLVYHPGEEFPQIFGLPCLPPNIPAGGGR